MCEESLLCKEGGANKKSADWAELRPELSPRVEVDASCGIPGAPYEGGPSGGIPGAPYAGGPELRQDSLDDREEYWLSEMRGVRGLSSSSLNSSRIGKKSGMSSCK